MRIMRNKWMMTVINIAVVTLLFTILAPVYDLYHYINQLFYLAYFYLGIGMIAWVTREASLTESPTDSGASLIE